MAFHIMKKIFETNLSNDLVWKSKDTALKYVLIFSDTIPHKDMRSGH